MMTATDAWQRLWRTTAWLLGALSHFQYRALFMQIKDYYEILKQTTKLENNLNFDLTAWIKWHLKAVNSAIKQAISSLKG